MTNNYIVVSPNLKRAAILHRRLVEYLVDHHITCRVVKNGHYILVDVVGEQTVIRFTSDRKFDEVATGMHDAWVVNEQQVEEWLDAAEENEKE